MTMKNIPPEGREHEVGNLASAMLTLDLNREIQDLRAEARWQSGHTAKTIAKYPDFRVVLIAMNAGGRMEKHQTAGRISVHALQGRIRFQTAERSTDLIAGQLLTLESNIRHDVEAITDSAFLLTIAFPAATAH